MFNNNNLSTRSLEWATGLGTVLFLLLVGCGSTLESLTSVATPTVRISSTRLSGLTLDHVDLEMELEVQNPATVPIPLLDVQYTLSSRGISLLSGRTELDGVVPAHGTERIPLRIGVDLADVVRTLSGVRPGAVVPYRIALELGVDAAVVGGVQLPVSHEGRLPIPTIPRLRVSSFRWAELSLQRVRGTMELSIGNPNAFALSVQRVDATLELASQSVAQVLVEPDRTIQPEMETSLEVPVEFDAAKLGASALDLLGTGSTAYLLGGRLIVDTRFGPLEMMFVASGEAEARR